MARDKPLSEVLNLWKNQNPFIPRPKCEISPRKTPELAGNAKIVIEKITLGVFQSFGKNTHQSLNTSKGETGQIYFPNFGNYQRGPYSW